jgi:rhamnogalacturonyl hydrolase YesR
MNTARQNGKNSRRRMKVRTIHLPSLCRLRATLRLLLSRRPLPGETREHLQSAMQWLCRAQDVTGNGGISYGYGFSEGWLPAYPETTGYTIPTFLRYASFTGENGYIQRALAMADWELTVQAPDGGFAGGHIGSSGSRSSVAFDTGQILQGFVAIYRQTGREKYLRAAEHAGNWLIEQLSEEGTWRDVLPNQDQARQRAYNARTSWALLELAEATLHEQYRAAAQRSLGWTVRCQLPNGWFRENSFEVGRPALTHTIAYVLEGLLESWGYLQEPCLLEATLRGAEELRKQFECRGRLPATFAENWESQDSYSCLAGCAQTSVVWFRLFEVTRQNRFLDAAQRMNQYLKTVQIPTGIDPSAEGGIPGSYPVYGAYECLRLPNWAAKFFADAMLAEARLNAEDRK